MIRAAEIAQERARARSTNHCWRYAKKALLSADAVDSYPGTRYAKQAGSELAKNYGFKPFEVSSPPLDQCSSTGAGESVTLKSARTRVS